MIRRPPRSTRTDTLFPYTTLFRSQRRVEDAVAKGAVLLHGNDRQGALYPPTVVDRVPYDCELVREETFGPVAPVIRFTDIDDAIRISNSTAYGLSSGVCTNHLEHITRFVSELRVGTVNVWERSEEHTSELQSLMRISYAVLCLKK